MFGFATSLEIMYAKDDDAAGEYQSTDMAEKIVSNNGKKGQGTSHRSRRQEQSCSRLSNTKKQQAKRLSE
jgi:hypothetical protein